ncbi:uncharacterized protein NH340_JMT00577 [Sarcoptes scabiei]|nr:uncharacterized protein NH340_JMT00577 [Sarcoptes scabiei]
MKIIVDCGKFQTFSFHFILFHYCLSEEKRKEKKDRRRLGYFSLLADLFLIIIITSIWRFHLHRQIRATNYSNSWIDRKRSFVSISFPFANIHLPPIYLCSLLSNDICYAIKEKESNMIHFVLLGDFIFSEEKIIMTVTRFYLLDHFFFS